MRLHVAVAPAFQEIDCFIEVFVADAARVVPSGNKKYLQVRIFHMPILMRIALLHYPEEILKTVHAEDKTAQRVLVIVKGILFVSANPGERVLLFLKLFVIGRKSQEVQEVLTVITSPEKAYSRGQCQADALCGIV